MPWRLTCGVQHQTTTTCTLTSSLDSQYDVAQDTAAAARARVCTKRGTEGGAIKLKIRAGKLGFPRGNHRVTCSTPAGPLSEMEARRRSSALEVQSTCHCWARLCCTAKHYLLGMSLRVRRQPQDGHCVEDGYQETRSPETFLSRSPSFGSHP